MGEAMCNRFSSEFSDRIASVKLRVNGGQLGIICVYVV